ncbi:MAG: chorismate mutase, partial [Planctomycetota bacterium]
MCHDSAPEQDPAGGGPTPDVEALADLRRRIDEVDRRLVEVLSERARIVVEIGKAKRAGGTPIYAPHREVEVLKRALAANPGPLPDRTIEAVYRELMSGSFALELPLRVGYLGPPGSFSHIAALKHFGSSVECMDMQAIDGVFEDVAARRCHYGLVPYENSIGGSIADTLAVLGEYDVTIYAETLIEVSHTLLANCEPEAIRTIHSKREVFAQCRRWLGTHFPAVELVPVESSAAAVKQAADQPHAAAIGSTLAGELYGVKPRFERIEDRANNITRFLVIGREEALPTGDDKTTIMFVTTDKPGALVDVLAVFRDAEVNLSHIDKRPSGRVNWEYTFFIDCEGHRSDPAMQGALEE